MLVVELEDAVEDADLVVAQRLLAVAVELQERLELGFLVRVLVVRAEDVVEEFCNRISDWS